MIKLIKLEWKKNHIQKYLRNVLIMAVCICLFVLAFNFGGIAVDEDTGVIDVAPGMEGITATIEMFTSMAFLVFTGVMLASFIVSAFKNKTMNLMFSYPIKRQKILASQMLSVWIFNFAFLTLTKIIIYTSVQICSGFMKSAFELDFNMSSASFYVQLVFKSAVIVSLGFIALFVGLAAKSSKAAIITSFLLIFLTQGNIGDYSLADNLIFPAVLIVISLTLAVLSVYNVEKKDLA